MGARANLYEYRGLLATLKCLALLDYYNNYASSENGSTSPPTSRTRVYRLLILRSSRLCKIRESVTILAHFRSLGRDFASSAKSWENNASINLRYFPARGQNIGLEPISRRSSPVARRASLRPSIPDAGKAICLPYPHFYFVKMRVARIELASPAWEAEVLPLNHTRNMLNYLTKST